MIVPACQGEDLSRAIHALRAQSLTDWQAVIAGGPCTAETQRLTARDERFTFAMTDEGAPWAARVNAGMERATGVYVMVLEGRDYLSPQALEALVSAAQAGATDARAGTRAGAAVAGAFGGYAFAGPLGVMPIDPLTGQLRQDPRAGGVDRHGHEPFPNPLPLGGGELARCKLIPLHAQIVRRELASRVRFEASPEAAGDHRWLLSLAGLGARWAWAGGRVAVCAMERPATSVEIARRLTAHARVIDAALAAGGSSATDRAAALASHAEAGMMLEGFERMLAQQREGADTETALATHTEFGNLFAQWWQRSRFFGQPPRHVMAASVHAAVPRGARADWGVATPETIAARLIETAEDGRAVILLGLGRNARHIARILHARGRRVVGRDDGLDTPPAWADEDRIPVVLLPREEPWDASAHYLMTPTDDAGFMARVPSGAAGVGMRVSRWAATPALLRQGWIEGALPRLLNGEMLSGGPRVRADDDLAPSRAVNVVPSATTVATTSLAGGRR